MMNFYQRRHFSKLFKIDSTSLASFIKHDENELKISWDWTETELRINWDWTENELRLSWEWAENELRMSQEWAENKPGMSWEWTETKTQQGQSSNRTETNDNYQKMFWKSFGNLEIRRRDLFSTTFISAVVAIDHNGAQASNRQDFIHFGLASVWSLSWNCTGCIICCNFLAQAAAIAQAEGFDATPIGLFF